MKNYPLYETTVFEDFRIMTENVARKYPDRTGISYKKDPHDKETVRVTFAQAQRDIRGLGTFLAELGCREKHCAIIGGSSYGWVASYFALMSIGAVTVPLDKDWSEEDLRSTVERAECEYVFYSADAKKKIAAMREHLPRIKEYICMWGEPLEDDRTVQQLMDEGDGLYKAGNNTYYDYDLDPDRMASIVFTSGTTGQGKGVMLSQTNIVSDMTQGMYNFAITPKTLNVLPPHHTFGSTVNFVGHYAQGAEVYISSGTKFILKELQEQQPSHLIMVPLFIEKFYKRIWTVAKEEGKDKMLRRIMKCSNALRRIGIDLRPQLFGKIRENFGGKLEMIICGGAELRQDIIDMFESIGITVLNGYGITECAPLVTCNRNKLQKKGSVGIPIIGEKLKIRDPDANGEGEICVKGPNVMLGYYKDEAATAAAFDEEGYFLTGDYGRLDEDGWLYITGRLKNIIVLANGKNVYPEELELAISRIEGVEEVIVYAGESKTDSDKEILVAEIFPDTELLNKNGVTDVQKFFEDAIRKKVNSKMVAYKKIGLVKIRDEEFTKNTSRKIVRFKIDKFID